MLHPISISDAERDAGTISSDKLQAAVHDLRVDGFATLLNVAQVSHINAVHDQMIHDIGEWNATAPEPFRGGSFTPSRQPDLLFRDILMNPIAAAVIGELLGREVTCGMYASNVTGPGLGEQELHVDGEPTQEGVDLSFPCSTVVLNYPLIDFTIENGATELWPGTQHMAREPGEFGVSERLQHARRAIAPPVRAVLPRGSALIRDIRLWHRGTLNQGTAIRPMLSMILNGKYRPGEESISAGPFPRAAQAFFLNNPAIYYNPQFVDGDLKMMPGLSPQLSAPDAESLTDATFK